MVDTIMLLVSQINQAIITASGVGMDNTIQVHFAAYNALQRLLGAIGNDFRVDHATSLENAEYGGFTIGTTASFPFDSFGAKVGFINFYFSLKRRGVFTIFGDPFPDQQQVSVDGIPV